MVSSILPLTIEAAVVRKRGKTIVGPVSTKVGAEGFTIVLGPNGSGKTSLLRMMHGLEHPREGNLQWQGDPADIRTRQSFVFQAPVMMQRPSVDNLAYPLLIRGTPKVQAIEKAKSWIEKVGLQNAYQQNAKLMSGGEKQKLAIARALITEPDVLFLDEPTTNLDGRSTREIETILLEAYQTGTRIIMATHDLGQARRLASDVLFLYRGQLHESGLARAFFKKPETPEASAFLNGDILE